MDYIMNLSWWGMLSLGLTVMVLISGFAPSTKNLEYRGVVHMANERLKAFSLFCKEAGKAFSHVDMNKLEGSIRRLNNDYLENSSPKFWTLGRFFWTGVSLYGLYAGLNWVLAVAWVGHVAITKLDNDDESAGAKKAIERLKEEKIDSVGALSAAYLAMCLWLGQDTDSAASKEEELQLLALCGEILESLPVNDSAAALALGNSLEKANLIMNALKAMRLEVRSLARMVAYHRLGAEAETVFRVKGLDALEKTLDAYLESKGFRV